MTDLISRADAIKAVADAITEGKYNGTRERSVMNCGLDMAIKIIKGLPSADATVGDYPNDLISRSALMEYCSNQKSKTISNNDIARFPSADAVPTVIRAKTFMRKEDFDKWAEDIKKQNKSIVCIPCDAEVVSAEAVQIPIKLEKRYPESKDEDITDAFMRGYLAGRSSADAVQGEWIEKYNGNGWNDFWDYTCSNCGKKYERADAVLYHANYCPNCGARMYKGGDSE